jgi:hypothetical protein
MTAQSEKLPLKIQEINQPFTKKTNERRLFGACTSFSP